MKLKNSIIAAVVAVAAFTLAGQVNATPIFDFANYGIGYSDPPIPQPEDNIGTMISVYNGTSPNVVGGETYTIDKGIYTPAPALGPALTDLSGSTVSDTQLSTGIYIPVGATYLSVKWDGENGGGAYYYVGSLTNTTIYLDESDASVFTTKTINPSGYQIWSGGPPPPPSLVPEGASTVVLLGAALTGLSLIRRRFAK